jgi:hypothetical protein
MQNQLPSGADCPDFTFSEVQTMTKVITYTKGNYFVYVISIPLIHTVYY